MSAFLITYAMHSTLFLGGAWLVLVLWRSAGPERREIVWKCALAAGIVTASAVHLLAGPELQSEAPFTSAEVVDGLSEIVADPGGGPVIEESPFDSWLTPLTGWLSGTVALSPAVGGWFFWLWMAGAMAGLASLAGGFRRLRVVLGQARVVDRDHEWRVILDEILAFRGIRRPVWLLAGDILAGPAASGLGRWRIVVPEDLLGRLDGEQARAVLAHEVAHLRRGDAWWSLAAELCCAVFFFQPLHFLARRRLRQEAEFLADREAARTLRNPAGLARCLVMLGEWLSAPGRSTRLATCPAAVGMASQSSLLGRRVADLVSGNEGSVGSSRAQRAICVIVSLALAAAVLGIAPRAELQAAEEKAKSAPEETSASAGGDIEGFRGVLRGRVVEKDVEAGRFTLEVSGIVASFKNSRTKGEGIVGHRVNITGISGEPLDLLIALKPDDEVEIEAIHDGGDSLRGVPREHFKRAQAGADKKMAAAGDAEMKESGMAPGMAGFRGILAGELLKKDIEASTLTIQVATVPRVWKRNQADPEALIGKTIPVRGIAGKWLDVLIGMDPGDTIEVEAFQNEGAVFDFVQEHLKKVE